MAARDRTTEGSGAAAEAAPGLTRAWTWLVALAGAALVVAAAVDVLGDDGDWTVVALGFGGLFLALGPIVFHRLVSASVGVHGFSFELGRSIAALGAVDTAHRVDRWGGGLTEAANAYATAHTVLEGREHTAARTRLQDHFVDEARASALVQQYDADEVRALFRKAPPVVRVLVLGLMLGDPSLADAATIEDAITRSRTGNEQYQGLRLALLVGPRLPVGDRRRLRAAIEADPMIRTGQDRTTLSAEALVLLAGGADEADDEGGDGGDGGDDPARRGRRTGGRGASGEPGEPGEGPASGGDTPGSSRGRRRRGSGDSALAS